jgi:hypothetical protein
MASVRKVLKEERALDQQEERRILGFLFPLPSPIARDDEEELAAAQMRHLIGVE